jgi:hypothetical protein
MCSPPNTNCNKSCYLVPGMLPLKKTLIKLCKIAGVKYLDTTPGKFGCDTFIYHRFPDYNTMVKYQNCESTQKLYQDKMFPYKVSLFLNLAAPPALFSLLTFPRLLPFLLAESSYQSSQVLSLLSSFLLIYFLSHLPLWLSSLA